jgi:hypothetical protein
MRTKTLLAMVTALAVGIGSSLAQTYSQNIVGYVNLTITNGLYYNAATIQMNCGVSNGLNEVFSAFTAAQNGDIVYLWDAPSQSFLGGGYYFFFDGVNATWYDQAGNGVLISTYPVITAGDSCFIQGAGVAAFDSVPIVGNVPINNGDTKIRAFYGDLNYTLQGSQLPTSGGLYNLGCYPPDGTVVYIWDPVTQGFKDGGYYFYSGVNGGASGGWYTQAGNGAVLTGTGITFTNGGIGFADIPIKVSDGLYIQGGAASPGAGGTNWSQTLQIP